MVVAPETPTGGAAMTVNTYLVDGMTCAHCAAAVTREVAAIPGVEAVDVDVPARTVVVTAAAEPDDAAVAAAVAEAGYAFAGRR
jgi:copper chaperone